MNYEEMQAFIAGAERMSAAQQVAWLQNNLRLDAAPSLFLQQELQFVDPRVLETPFAPMKSERLIPMRWNLPAGAEQHGFTRWSPHGVADWISRDATDLPTVSVDRKRILLPIDSAGDRYEYTVQDLRSAAMANQPLEVDLARAARLAMDMFHNRVMLVGSTKKNYTGFVNDPSVSITSAPNGNWISGANPDHVIADLTYLLYSVLQKNTKEVFPPTTLCLPIAQAGYIRSTARSANSDTTIWEFFRDNNDYVKELETMLELDAAGGSGSQRAVMYRKDPDVLEGPGSILFESFAPQLRGLSVQVPCHSRFAPLSVKIPVAVAYMDGI